ncbi:MAG TPA: hypothetical protein VME68_16535 [Acidobacteriaceae bacterium]|nr:hypothetical protein [Acidobacteriaceae bacterium]
MRRLSSGKVWVTIAMALAVVLSGARLGWAQDGRAAEWRTATDAELKSVIPARAPVVTERIETEMRSASGVTNGKGKYIAGVVLITAGYSAEGKYSHFFLTQVPLKLGTSTELPAGEYVIGYEHTDNGLLVHFFEAATGKPAGSVLATLISGITRVEQIRVWPPKDRAVIQIGRFGIPYQIGG